MSLAARMRDLRERFRPGFEDVILDWLTRDRRAAAGRDALGLEVLASPHRSSPFLPAAEWLEPARDGLPHRVLKLLAVADDDPSEPFWRGVLEREGERWQGELSRRLATADQVATLGLPLSVPRGGNESLVEIAELGPLRRADLLENAPAEANLRFAYLARPFVAWPRLADVGYPPEELRRRWRLFCEERAVPAHLREPLFPHFCDEALVDGDREVLLASAWRLEAFR